MASKFSLRNINLNPFKAIATPAAKKKAEKKRLMDESYAVQVRRLRQDVGMWRDALDRAENVYYPDRTQLLNIYADLVLDLHLSSVLETRRINVLSRPFRMVDASGKENPQITQLLKKPWFRKFGSLALEKIAYGHSLIEFGLPVDGEFQDVELIDRQYVFPEAGILRTMPGMITGVNYREDPQYAPWLIEVGEVDDLGLLNKVAPMGLYKKNVVGAWADFTEIFGMPYRAAFTEAEGKELEEIEKIMSEMGQNSWGVFPDDVRVEFISAATANEQLYNAFIDRANSEISKAVLGQTMTTDNGSSMSQANVHERVAQAYTRDDSEFLAELINFKLLPFLIKHGYALQGYRFEWDETESLNKTEQWKIVNEVIQRGYQVPASYITATFNIPVEEAKPAAEAGPGGGGPGGQGGPAPAPEVKPILGYHIETGTVNRNEARAQLNLPAENEDEAIEQRKLKGQLSIVQAATAAGVPLELALQLAKLNLSLPAAAPAAPEPGAAENITDNKTPDQPGKSEGSLPAEAVSPVAELRLLYSATCCGPGLEHVTAAAADGPLQALWERLIQVVYASAGDPAGLLYFVDLPLFEFLNEQLQGAIEVAWNATDPKLKKFLSKNVARFSGFKSYQVCQELTRKLYDAEGKIRAFADFKADALAINQQYNVQYLKTEYEHAVAGAQMASKWSTFEPGALLQYRTVGDDLVRPEHRKWNNITLPASHPWWESHYPPNDWNCRCDALEVGEDEAQTSDEQLPDLPEVPSLFRNNVGKTGQIFSEDHPYFNVPAKVAKKVATQLKLDL